MCNLGIAIVKYGVCYFLESSHHLSKHKNSTNRVAGFLPNRLDKNKKIPYALHEYICTDSKANKRPRGHDVLLELKTQYTRMFEKF